MPRTSTRLALLLGIAAAATAATAQAYEWGGGSCVGYGCVRDVHDGEYRPVRRVYREEGYGPRVRVYEERRHVVPPQVLPSEDDLDDED